MAEMDDLTEVEQELRRALRHRAAPDGFTQGVMARLEERRRVDTGRRGAGTLLQSFPAAAWWAAAAAALLMTVGGANSLRIRHQQRAQRVDAAEAQVDEALQLTGHALTRVTGNVSRSPAGQVAQLLLQAPR